MRVSVKERCKGHRPGSASLSWHDRLVGRPRFRSREPVPAKKGNCVLVLNGLERGASTSFWDLRRPCSIKVTILSVRKFHFGFSGMTHYEGSWKAYQTRK